MRKTIAVLLLMLFTMPVCFGETELDLNAFNLDSLTDEQLLILKDAVEQQLLLRKTEEADLMHVGRYDVGKIIEPGYYYFIGTGIDGYWDEVTVSESDKKYDLHDYVFSCLLREGETAGVFLEEGNCVGVSSGAVFCFKREHLPNWVK